MDMTTPALLFPAISLLFVAYTNRLHSLSVLIRAMTTEGSDESKTKHTEEQLDILQKRVNYIKRMQVFGIVSFIFNLLTIICIYINYDSLANYVFGFGLFLYAEMKEREIDRKMAENQRFIDAMLRVKK